MSETISRFGRAAIVVIGALVGCGAITMACMVWSNWGK